MVHEALDQLPFPICKEPVDEDFTIHRIGSAPDCQQRRTDGQPTRRPARLAFDYLWSPPDGDPVALPSYAVTRRNLARFAIRVHPFEMPQPFYHCGFQEAL